MFTSVSTSSSLGRLFNELNGFQRLLSLSLTLDTDREDQGLGHKFRSNATKGVRFMFLIDDVTLEG